MIAYEWCAEIPERLAGELATMLGAAAAYDAEAGFSTAGAPESGAGVVHLLVTMPPRGQRGSPELDRLPEAEVVAYLRLERADGGATAQTQFVVREEFRSLGVGTLLFERLREEAGGWAAQDGLEAVRCWAHGDHPAAQRMSWRFNAHEERELLKTVRPIGGRHAIAEPEPERAGEPTVAPAYRRPDHLLGIAPEDRELLVSDGVLVRRAGGGGIVVRHPGDARALVELDLDDGSPEEIDDLIVLGLTEAQRRGARLAVLYVDAAEALVLHVSRELGFFHDQSDRDYVLDVKRI